MPAMIQFLSQPAHEIVDYETAWQQLEMLRPVLQGTAQ